MLRKFYLIAWLSVLAAVLISIITGTITAEALFVFSLIVLALVYSMMLWTVIVNTRKTKPE